MYHGKRQSNDNQNCRVGVRVEKSNKLSEIIVAVVHETNTKENIAILALMEILKSIINENNINFNITFDSVNDRLNNFNKKFDDNNKVTKIVTTI